MYRVSGGLVRASMGVDDHRSGSPSSSWEEGTGEVGCTAPPVLPVRYPFSTARKSSA